METMFNQWPIPEFDKDPYYDEFSGLMNQVDLSVYHVKNASNLFFIGGGVVTWSAGLQILSWTEDFVLPLMMSGFEVLVPYGPDGINRAVGITSGSFVYIELPTLITSNQTVKMKSASVWSGKDGVIVLAYNKNNILYFRDGTKLV